MLQYYFMSAAEERLQEEFLGDGSFEEEEDAVTAAETKSVIAVFDGASPTG